MTQQKRAGEKPLLAAAVATAGALLVLCARGSDLSTVAHAVRRVNDGGFTLADGTVDLLALAALQLLLLGATLVCLRGSAARGAASSRRVATFRAALRLSLGATVLLATVKASERLYYEVARHAPPAGSSITPCRALP